jgi:hypothetical protein
MLEITAAQDLLWFSDAAFVLGMIPHHQGAIDMAEIVLKYGSDHHNHELAADHPGAKTRNCRNARMAEAEEPAATLT